MIAFLRPASVDRHRGFVYRQPSCWSTCAFQRLFFFVFTCPLDTQRMQTSHISQIPALTPLSLSHLCAKYLRAQFQNKLNARSSGASATPAPQPLMLPVALALELDMISATLIDAFLNRSEWNRTHVLNCQPFIGRNGGFGYFALCREAAEKAFEDRNQGIKKKGSLAKTAIYPTEWS